MPETSSSGLIIPEAFRNLFDGYNYEVVSVGEKAKELLTAICEIGEKVIIGLRSDVEGEPLDLQPDDIIQVKGASPTYSPELSAHYGYTVWFLDVITSVNGRDRSTVEVVYPSKNWKQGEEAA